MGGGTGLSPEGGSGWNRWREEPLVAPSGLMCPPSQPPAALVHPCPPSWAPQDHLASSRWRPSFSLFTLVALSNINWRPHLLSICYARHCLNFPLIFTH